MKQRIAPPLRALARTLAPLLGLALALASPLAAAAGDLPPPEAVARALDNSPLLQAAGHRIDAEQANKERLEAGAHEWALQMGTQRRRTLAPGEPRYSEWNAGLARAFRLPGKAALDSELGDKGVEIARMTHEDQRHESSRLLLQSWFGWLRAREGVGLWQAQVDILQRQAQAVARRRQLGDAARIEGMQADAAAAAAGAQLAQAEARAAASAEDLRRLFPELPLPERIALSQPQAPAGTEQAWIDAIVAGSHELATARLEAERARLSTRRTRQEELPDPTLGVHVGHERGGEERIIGLTLSVPLPGAARRAGSAAAGAEAAASSAREAAVLRRISADAARLYLGVHASRSGWQRSEAAAAQLTQAADLTARAYQLGEGSLAEVLAARRLAFEAQLAARQLQLDALEQGYRLELDAHRLWDIDAPANASVATQN